jgi:hypothetical protein
MPYLPLELDGKKAAARVARAVGVSPGDVLWGLAELWEHVFNSKDPVVGELILDGCFGPNPKMRESLIAFGFLEPAQYGFRVKGSDRLIGASEARTVGGKARAAGAQRDNRGRLLPKGAPPAPPPANPAESPATADGGQHRQVGTSNTPANAGGDLEPATSKTPALTPSTQHPVTTPLAGARARGASPGQADLLAADGKTPLDVVADAYERVNGVRPRWGIRQENDLRPLGDVSDEELGRRAERAFRNTGYPKVATPHELVKHWDHFAADRQAAGGGGAKDLRKGRVGAEDVNPEAFREVGRVKDF